MRSTIRSGARAVPVAAFVIVAALGGCATAPVAAPRAGQPDIPIPGTPEARRTPALPAIPATDGPLALEIGYPAPGALITARDSNFIFGSTGSGRTQSIQMRIAQAHLRGLEVFLLQRAAAQRAVLHH
jgi:hypothetical protein